MVAMFDCPIFSTVTVPFFWLLVFLYNFRQFEVKMQNNKNITITNGENFWLSQFFDCDCSVFLTCCFFTFCVCYNPPPNFFFQSTPKLPELHALVYLDINSQRAVTPDVSSSILRGIVRNGELQTFTKRISKSIFTFKQRSIHILKQKNEAHLMVVEFLKKLQNWGK